MRADQWTYTTIFNALNWACLELTEELYLSCDNGGTLMCSTT